MEKNYVWVIEAYDIKKGWTPYDIAWDSRQQARKNMGYYKKVDDLKFRIRKYIREEK